MWLFKITLLCSAQHVGLLTGSAVDEYNVSLMQNISCHILSHVIQLFPDDIYQVVDEKAIKKAGQWDIYAEIYSPYVSPSSIMPNEMQVNLAAALQGDSTLAAVAQDPEFPSWVGGYSTHDSHFESDPEGVSAIC